MERSLKWVEQQGYGRFGCTSCGWSHPNPSLREDPATIDQAVLNFIKREFAGHICDNYPARRSESRVNADLTGKVTILPTHTPRTWFGWLARYGTSRADATG